MSETTLHIVRIYSGQPLSETQSESFINTKSLKLASSYEKDSEHALPPEDDFLYIIPELTPKFGLIPALNDYCPTGSLLYNLSQLFYPVSFARRMTSRQSSRPERRNKSRQQEPPRQEHPRQESPRQESPRQELPMQEPQKERDLRILLIRDVSLPQNKSERSSLISLGT
jgi:hypothetical protein